MRKQYGFTLIELLVVIVIIGLLTALLLPVLARARVRADTRTCASNLQQLHRAIAMYAQDYGGYLPPQTTTLDNSPNVSPVRHADRAAGLIGALTPYAKATGIWFCPADPYARSDKLVPFGSRTPFIYGVNHRLTSYYTSDWWYGPFERTRRRMSPVLGKTPLDYSWRNDATGESMGASDTELMGDGLNLEGLGCQQPGAYSHDGWYNRLYFDGHVRAEACR